MEINAKLKEPFDVLLGDELRIASQTVAPIRNSKRPAGKNVYGSASPLQVQGLSNTLMVALSTADSNKWLLLKEGHLERQTPEDRTSSDNQLLSPICQRQRRLTAAQVVKMYARYEGGATVFELAAEFGCHRTTVAGQLKKAGIAMRFRSHVRSH